MRRPPLRTRLDIAVDAPTLEYTLFGKDLHFTGVTARMAFTESQLTMTDVQAELFGGTLRGEAVISIRKGKPGHTAHVEFDGVDFTKLTKLYFDYNESQGKLHGTYDFTGAGDDGRVMRGHGGITVMEGQVFAIPFLGPFSGFLNDLVPGMGYQKARRASATFTVDEGVIATKDFVIVGRGFSMIGDGEIGFLDDRLDFDMRVNAQGLPGVVLFPVSKLLEYETRGKFSEPSWRLKIVPRFGPANRTERGKEHERPREPERSKEPAERVREPERVKEPERAKETERVRAR